MMNKTFCRLFGGHQYSPSNSRMVHAFGGNCCVIGLTLIRRCSRCGKEEEIYIPRSVINNYRSCYIDTADELWG